jgi:subtilisin family serine protease
MATPAVAGLAARLWSSFPQCTGTQIRNALKATAVRPANGDVVKFGKGIVKVKAAHDYLTTYGCAGAGSGGGDTGGGGSTCKGKKCS